MRTLAPGALLAIALLATSCSSAIESGTGDSSETSASTTAISTTATSTTNSPTTVETTEAPTATVEATAVEPTVVEEPVVRTGAQRLVDDDFAALAGRRVGLIVHQNSVVHMSGAQRHLVDAAAEHPEVDVVALFSPEHGVRGTADAGELVGDSIDPSTGLPIFSLFGDTRQPTPEMLTDIDTLVYDLQDVGARYYTYISTMGLAMQAANAAGIDFVVLDRPNPLGGTIGGGVMSPERTSFVGQYPIPAQYGLTAGELARLILVEGWLDGLDGLSLSVVELDGWSRSMTWEDTNLPWLPPSPAITSPNTALLYPATIYFEALSLSYGRGTDAPFTRFGAPWLDTGAAVEALRSRNLPGLDAEAIEITPTMLPDMTVEPAFLDQTIPTVQLIVTDSNAIRPTEVGIHLLDIVVEQAADAGVDPLARPEWLDQLSGSTLLREAIVAGDVDPEVTIEEQAAQRQSILSTLEGAQLYD